MEFKVVKINQEFKNVLVPVAGGPNSAFALEMASILVDIIVLACRFM